jgi:hypothetical protein
MRARVLITDGVRTVDLFWLHHDGKDVYCGTTGFPEKRSYHASGKIHSTRQGKREDEAWHTPLKNLKGQYQLTSMDVKNIRRYIQLAAPKFEYSGRKSDVVLTVDTRSVPAGVNTSITVGLLEPRNAKALMFLLSLAVPAEMGEFTPRQMVIATSEEPWVYALLYWWRLPGSTQPEQGRRPSRSKPGNLVG